jgi:hypothetical protein
MNTARVHESAFRTLDERVIIRTLEVLRNRVFERFPTRGLAKTAGYLVDAARRTSEDAALLAQKRWGLRLLSLVIMGAGAASFVWLVRFYSNLEFSRVLTLPEFTQGLDATLNIMLICGLAVGFSVSLESRFKRVKALKSLYRLRALAHVIDMHQLTKDPTVIIGTERTESSPLRDLSPKQLIRYLDYCTEMLSLIGKLAALFAQTFPDPAIISAVNDIEELTTNLSRKIWQKIMITQQTERVA